MLSSKGYMCRKCFDALFPRDLLIVYTDIDFTKRSATCRCANVAIIWDEDITPRIYVDDITTVQPIIVFHKENYEEVQRLLLKPLTSAIYCDMVPVKTQELTYRPLAKKNKYERKTSTKYNTVLIAALDRYKHTTSDGTEEFLTTTLNDPLKAD